MAYNIFTPGSGKFSINAPVIFTAFENVNRIANADYKYVCDIYIDSVIVTRLKAVPDPTTGQGIFDIGPVIRNYVNTTAKASTTAIKVNEYNNYAEVQCKFGDEYGGVLFTNVVVDSLRKFYNYYNPWPNLNQDILTSLDNKWLTDRPLKMRIDRAAIGLYAPFLNNQTVGNFTLAVKAYNAAGLITTDNITIPGVSDKVQIYDVSRQHLFNVSGILNQSDLEYYTFEISGIGLPVYRVDLECQIKYQTYPVIFMNRYGAYESHYFTKASTKTLDVERKTFRQQGYSVGASGVVSYATDNVYMPQGGTYSQQTVNKFTLRSDLLTDADWQWLWQLVNSPDVYIMMDGYLVPVKVTTNNYEYKYWTRDSISPLEIGVEFFAPYNTQYR